MKRVFVNITILTVLALFSCRSSVELPFKFVDNNKKLSLFENGGLVFEYQKTLNSIDDKFARNNYIHPLMSIDGDTLTEDFPKDHIHHNGLFWAWHQIYIDSIKVSDSWIMENFESKLVDFKYEVFVDSAVIKLRLEWDSPKYKNGIPYIEENTTITTHKKKNNVRKIDFKIELKALVNNVRIGGSNNQKGYGGFSIRLKMPDSLQFYSENGKITPQKYQINAGTWMEFKAPFGKYGWSSLILRKLPSSPNYMQPWILRQKSSMQNIVFPGRELMKVPNNKSLSLCYTIEIKNVKNKLAQKNKN